MLNSSGWEFHHDRSENICVNAVFCPPKLVQNSLFGSAPQNFYTTSSALINRGFTYLKMNLISHNGKLSFFTLFASCQTRAVQLCNYVAFTFPGRSSNSRALIIITYSNPSNSVWSILPMMPGSSGVS